MSSHAEIMLRDYLERILRLREQRRNLSADIRDVMGEATGFGFSKKAFHQVVLRAEKDRSEVVETDMIVSTYEEALGSDNHLLDPLMNSARDTALIERFASPPEVPKKLTAAKSRALNAEATADAAKFAERALGLNRREQSKGDNADDG